MGLLCLQTSCFGDKRGEDHIFSNPGNLKPGATMFWSALMVSLPWQVNDQEMKKQQDEITAIMKMREASSSGTQVCSGHGNLFSWGPQCLL